MTRVLLWGLCCVLLFGIMVPLFAVQGQAQLIAERQTTLLAVTENGQQSTGTTATVTIEVMKGKGRVFLDTQPLTRLDTQLSTRLAKEIACSYIDYDCSQYDFIYTIQSSSPIVGGASAGAALSALTVAALLDLPVDPTVAITGTINTGGVVGPVGGVVNKVEAAGRRSLRNVAVPFGESVSRFTYTVRDADTYEPFIVTPLQDVVQGDDGVEIATTVNTSNVSIDSGTSLPMVDLREVSRRTVQLDVVAYGSSLGVRVHEITTLNELVLLLTGQRLFDTNAVFTTPQFYQSSMQSIAVAMCAQTTELLAVVSDSSMNTSLYVGSLDLYNQSAVALGAEQYYSAASFCFGANTRLEALRLANVSREALFERVWELQVDVEQFTVADPQTITDVQIYMLVRERLLEASTRLESAIDALQDNELDRARNHIAFATHRLGTAQSWSTFFGQPGRTVDLSQDVLQDACFVKIEEAQDRRQYAGLYFPQYLDDVSDELRRATESRDTNEFILCLYYASNAKAGYDTVIGSIGVTQDKLADYVRLKQDVAGNVIRLQAQEGVYPIVAYSFLEYSQSLSSTDTVSALLYAQYALELADLRAYFDTPSRMQRSRYVFTALDPQTTLLYVGVVSFVFGVLLAVTIVHLEKKVIAARHKRITKRKRT